MKWVIIILMTLTVLVVSGCSKEVTCNKPYIPFANTCCLDTNNNAVCDSDEKAVSNPVEEKVSPSWNVPEGQCYVDHGSQVPTVISKSCELNSDCYQYGRAVGETDMTKVKCSGNENSTKNVIPLTEIKSLVYNTIRQNIQKSIVGDFSASDTYPNTRCGSFYYYPSKNPDYNRTVVDATINDCDNRNDVPTPESYLGNPNAPVSLKTLTNGKIIVDERDELLYGNTRRQMYVVSFACQRYWITLGTVDFSGDGAWAIFADYTIDKQQMNNMANEIMGVCNK